MTKSAAEEKSADIQNLLPPFDGLFEDPGINTTGDAQLLANYMRFHKQQQPLPLGIGDPYLLGTTMPEALATYERTAPQYLGGYLRTPAGVPEARQQIRRLTTQRHALDAHAVPGIDFDLHLTSGTGTRGIMGDFGRYLLDRSAHDKRTPVVLYATPTWDYAGVLEPQGYHMAYWPLRPENGWLPDLADARRAAVAIDANPSQRLALVIINTQHNPTGRSWPASVLQGLFALATSHGAGILLDDPYYFVVTQEAQPESAAALLLAHLADKSTPAEARRLWCRVESFGKAFACNDWGIGSVIGHPDTLNELAGYTFRWAFPKAGKRQWAMAQWLADEACEQYLMDEHKALSVKRRLWADTLQQQGWPPELLPIGEATPYFLVAVPPAYLEAPDGIKRWRHDVLNKAGLLFGHASIEQEGTGADVPYLRTYLGGSVAIAEETARRFTQAGIRYNMTPKVNHGR